MTSARAEAPEVRSGGFTLLELLVVIAIMTALTAALPLTLNRFVPARRVDAAARELLADIRLAQARAASSGAVMLLAVKPHGYEIRSHGAAAAAKSREWRESTRLTLDPLVGDRPAGRLLLYPDGSSSGGRLRISDSARVRELRVSSLTGRVRLAAAVSAEVAS